MTFADHMRKAASDYMRDLLARHSQCVEAAAREAGINRTHFYRQLHLLGLADLIPHKKTGHRGNWQDLEPPRRRQHFWHVWSRPEQQSHQ